MDNFSLAIMPDLLLLIIPQWSGINEKIILFLNVFVKLINLLTIILSLLLLLIILLNF
jgi:hypothetical protein